jgi:hypothetical protein
MALMGSSFLKVYLVSSKAHIVAVPHPSMPLSSSNAPAVMKKPFAPACTRTYVVNTTDTIIYKDVKMLITFFILFEKKKKEKVNSLTTYSGR